jgi:hypothetical protein
LKMAYEFTENESELEPEPSAARGGFPPRKGTAVGVLDPSIPPNLPPSSNPAVSPVILRIAAGVVLAGLAVALFLMLFAMR